MAILLYFHTIFMTGSFYFQTPVLMDAANYYDTCMNTKQIEAVGDDPMKELVKKLGQ